MTREEALLCQQNSKPCLYIGRLGYLQGNWYIKQVKRDKVVVSSRLISGNWDDYHEIQLKQLEPTNYD